MKEALKNFDFINRINNVGNLSYGWAVPIMYPYVTIIPLAILYIVFQNINVAFNIFYVVLNILRFVVMYKSTYSIFHKKEVSIFASVLISLSSFKIYEMYVYGALGQNVATIFIPMVFVYYVGIMRKEKNSWIGMFVSWTLMFQSHIVTTFYVSILFIVITLLNIKYIWQNKKIIIEFLKFVLVSIVINLWYIVPFMDYYLSKNLVLPVAGFPWKMASKLHIFDHIILSIKIFLSNINLDMTYFDRISYMTIFVFVCVIVIVLKNKLLLKNDKDIENNDDKIKYFSDEKIAFLCIIIFIYNLIVCTGIFTRTFLGAISFIQKFYVLQQFENREISRGIYFLYIGASYYICKYLKNKKIIFFIIVILGLIPITFLYKNNLNKKVVLDNCYDYCNIDYLLNGTIKGDVIDIVKKQNKYSLPKNIFDGKIRVDNANIRIVNEKRGYLSYKIEYENVDKKNHKIEIPMFNYKQYVAYDEKGKILKIKSGENRYIQLDIKKEKGKINIKYKEPILWFICDIVSIISLLGFIIWYILNKMKIKYLSKN